MFKASILGIERYGFGSIPPTCVLGALWRILPTKLRGLSEVSDGMAMLSIYVCIGPNYY